MFIIIFICLSNYFYTQTIWSFIFFQFLLEDARSNEALTKPTKSHIPTTLETSADTTVTLPLRRPSPKEIDDKGKLFKFTQFQNTLVVDVIEIYKTKIYRYIKCEFWPIASTLSLFLDILYYKYITLYFYRL